MFASFLFGLKESQILFMGIFIGLWYCRMSTVWVDRQEVGIRKMRFYERFCFNTFDILAFFVESVKIFWITAIFIGFFIDQHKPRVDA